MDATGGDGVIAAKLTSEELDQLVANILHIWDSATDDEYARGVAWYRTANQLAELMSEGNTRRGAGVIAALSPMSAWETNLAQAEKALTAGSATGLHTGDAIRKAEAIMNGADPLSVLPTDSKTWNFFRCIVDPEDAEAVVIDRHAHDIAVGESYGSRNRGLSTKSRYATIALAYRLAAARVGALPSTVQAVTWVVWREMER